MSQSIAQQSDELVANFAAHAPQEVTGVFARQRAELDAAGVPKGVIAVGDSVPDVTLLDAHGAQTSLYAAMGEQPAVLVFYRGAWCPYCNIALRTYQERLVPALPSRQVTLIAVSPQKPDGSLSVVEKNELAFPVLSDPGNVLAGVLGIVFTPSEESVAAQRKLGLELTDENADGTVDLPMPTTAIIDTDHVVRWIDVRPDFGYRTEVPEILAALDTTL